MTKNLSGIFIIVFMLAALIFGAPALINGYSQSGGIAKNNAINGQWASLYEKEFSDILPVRKPGLTFWGMIELFSFQNGRPGVLIGKDGWLFTDEEFSFIENRDAVYQNHKDFIATTIQNFQKNNINLIIAIIPAKARVMEEKLGRYHYPDYNKPIYQEMMVFLKNKNVIAPDLYTALSNTEDVFLKTDTHWAPIGAKNTAFAIAKAINDNNIAPKQKTIFNLEAEKSETIEGDLTRYVPAGKLKENYGLQDLSIMQETALSVDDADNAEDNLFGDVILPITLIGTSYSANNSWNFEDYLKVALQSDLLNAADEGRGPFSTMMDYLNSNEFKESPPELGDLDRRYLVLRDDALDKDV